MKRSNGGNDNEKILKVNGGKRCSGGDVCDANAGSSVNVNSAINGVPVHADASMGAPFVTDNNRTMIPLRLVGEMVDCTVDYKDGVVTITNDAYDYSAIFKKDATTCTINGETKALDAPMVFTNGRSDAPIRALGESFGTVKNGLRQVRR